MDKKNKQIVLATSNAGKLAEIRAILGNETYNVISQSKFELQDAEETGLTFVENALIKARHACEHTGLSAIADDSGLEVDALSGAPGIYSARYAGVNASDQDNSKRLLSELKDIPENQRSARFWCVITYLRHAHDPSPIICQGSWEGHIAMSASGNHGFGYDPIFLPTGFDGTAAELTPGQKNQVSHRAQALVILRDLFGTPTNHIDTSFDKCN